MSIVLQAILSFIAATSFGIIFNAPRKMLAYCGFVGMTGWVVHSGYLDISQNLMQSSFLGAFTVALFAHVFAKRFRKPMIVFSVPGIIPLVPGGMAFNSMRYIVENDYITAMSFASKAFMVSGSIAMGLVFAEVIIQLVYYPLTKKNS